MDKRLQKTGVSMKKCTYSICMVMILTSAGCGLFLGVKRRRYPSTLRPALSSKLFIRIASALFENIRMCVTSEAVGPQALV